MALRALLGNAKKIVHDPGAKGPSGEGDAAFVMICLTYVACVGILFYEKFIKKAGDDEDQAVTDVKNARAAALEEGKGAEGEPMTDEELRDKITQEKWTQPANDGNSPEFRAKLMAIMTCGTIKPDSTGPVRDFFWALSSISFMKVGLSLFVFYNIWCFLLVLGIMGDGFKLLGGKDSSRMFDVVDNPISGVMIGILATVLVQSSSTTTSIIISLVGASELSVKNAVFMVMGANIGTSVTNTIVAMGHFNNQDDMRRGFAAATVHDVFNILTVAIFLPLEWATGMLQHMTYAMAKGQKICDTAADDCVAQDFLKPYISPYSKGIAGLEKDTAKWISQNYCAGECGTKYSSSQMKALGKVICANGDAANLDCSNIHKNYDSPWVAAGYLNKARAPAYITTDGMGKANGANGVNFFYSMPANASKPVKFWNGTEAVTPLKANTLYEVCGSKVKTGLCEKHQLKSGLLFDWKMNDESAGWLLTIMSLAGLCSCLFCIVYTLQIIVKGHAARILKQVVGFNGYLNILIGLGITIIVQSSSITTSTLTPIAAVGLIRLEDMLPLTLGANIGTTLTGIMAASVVTSNPVEGWQVALCHLFFNIFGIIIWYPVPRVRNVVLNIARFLGRMTAHPKYGKFFPLVYTFVVFGLIPGVCYGIAVAATQ